MKTNIVGLYANGREVLNYDSFVINKDHLIIISYDSSKFKSFFEFGKKYHFKLNLNGGMKVSLSKDYFVFNKVENNSNHAISFGIPITYKYYFSKV